MVLDAAALLALINAEPGWEVVASALGEAANSAVNLAEVVTADSAWRRLSIGAGFRSALKIQFLR